MTDAPSKKQAYSVDGAAIIMIGTVNTAVLVYLWIRPVLGWSHLLAAGIGTLLGFATERWKRSLGATLGALGGVVSVAALFAGPDLRAWAMLGFIACSSAVVGSALSQVKPGRHARRKRPGMRRALWRQYAIIEVVFLLLLALPALLAVWKL